MSAKHVFFIQFVIFENECGLNRVNDFMVFSTLLQSYHVWPKLC